MKEVTLHVDSLDKVSWPNICPACGNQLEETRDEVDAGGISDDVKAAFARLRREVAHAIHIDVKPGPNAEQMRGKPSKIRVRTCSRCELRVKHADEMAAFGVTGTGFACVVSLSTLIVDWGDLGGFDNEIKRISFIVVGFLGLLIYLLGKQRRKSVIGVQIRGIQKNRWNFRFNNKRFAKGFLKLNRSFAEEV